MQVRNSPRVSDELHEKLLRRREISEQLSEGDSSASPSRARSTSSHASRGVDSVLQASFQNLEKEVQRLRRENEELLQWREARERFPDKKQDEDVKKQDEGVSRRALEQLRNLHDEIDILKKDSRGASAKRSEKGRSKGSRNWPVVAQGSRSSTPGVWMPGGLWVPTVQDNKTTTDAWGWGEWPHFADSWNGWGPSGRDSWDSWVPTGQWDGAHPQGFGYSSSWNARGRGSPERERAPSARRAQVSLSSRIQSESTEPAQQVETQVDPVQNSDVHDQIDEKPSEQVEATTDSNGAANQSIPSNNGNGIEGADGRSGGAQRGGKAAGKAGFEEWFQKAWSTEWRERQRRSASPGPRGRVRARTGPVGGRRGLAENDEWNDWAWWLANKAQPDESEADAERRYLEWRKETGAGSWQ